MDRDIPMEQIRGLPEFDTALLPIFQQYKQENQSWIPDFDVQSYLNLRADFDLAAAFAKMFWPDVIEVEGCVILQGHYSPEKFAEWMAYFKGDPRAVESMINHVHIWDLFLNSPRDVEYPEQLFEFLASALMLGWRQVLQYTFPDKDFIFTVRYANGVEISFHQADTT